MSDAMWKVPPELDGFSAKDDRKRAHRAERVQLAEGER